MSTIHVSEARFLKLAAKTHLSLPNTVTFVIDSPHPESSDVPCVTLHHKKGSFFLDGHPVSETRMIRDSRGNKVPVASAPTWKVVAAQTLRLLGQKWNGVAREYCAKQDEGFLRSVGLIQND